jgi:hypothetical protein
LVVVEVGHRDTQPLVHTRTGSVRALRPEQGDAAPDAGAAGLAHPEDAGQDTRDAVHGLVEDDDVAGCGPAWGKVQRSVGGE